jgi:hypothetical protein
MSHLLLTLVVISPVILHKNARFWVKTGIDYQLLGDPAGARTQDPLIKSQLLYQLSYGVIPFGVCKGRGISLKKTRPVPFLGTSGAVQVITLIPATLNP